MARNTRVKSDITAFEKGIESFYAELGRYPTNAEGLQVLTRPSKNSAEGYIKKITKDPWKFDYIYRTPGPNNKPYEILCLGADGKEGGVGSNRDISSLSLENE